MLFDFMLSVGRSMLEHCPARSRICPFRRLPVQRGLDAALLSEGSRQLQDRGLKVRNAPMAVVDDSALAPLSFHLGPTFA